MTVKKSQVAFTLVEILIVIGIFLILAIGVLPLFLDFYKKYQLEVYTQEIIQTLRRAQLKSMSIEKDSAFGVYLSERNYVLFKGDSYVVRESQYDEIFNIPENIYLSGLTEVVFFKLSGSPSVSGDIILSSLNEEKTISINSVGRISYTTKLVLPPPPPPAPTVDIKAENSDGPININYNSSANLTWTSNNADSCTASGDWSGTKPVSGSESTGNLTSTKTYNITCENISGSASDSVIVNVGSPPLNCWGVAGSCDPFCQYTTSGPLTSYYSDNPGCTSACPIAGSFYISPGGPCSVNGTGFCYKMVNSLTKSISCSQGTSCGGTCTGTCLACLSITDEALCNQQIGCIWRITIPGPGPIPADDGTCTGRCASCISFIDQISCQNQQGCSWNSSMWNWNLNNYRTGYNSYVNCQWY